MKLQNLVHWSHLGSISRLDLTNSYKYRTKPFLDYSDIQIPRIFVSWLTTEIPFEDLARRIIYNQKNLTGLLAFSWHHKICRQFDTITHFLFLHLVNHLLPVVIYVNALNMCRPPRQNLSTIVCRQMTVWSLSTNNTKLTLHGYERHLLSYAKAVQQFAG